MSAHPLLEEVDPAALAAAMTAAIPFVDPRKEVPAGSLR